MMKPITVRAGLAAALLASAAACAQTASPAPAEAPAAEAVMTAPVPSLPPGVESLGEKPLVECNGKILTAGEADKLIERRLSAYDGQIPADQLTQLRPRLRQQVREEFVIRTLLEQESAKQNPKVDEAEIDKMIAETRENLPEGVTFAQFLAMQNLTEQTVRSEVRMQLGIRQLLDRRLGAEATPTEEDIVAFYESRKEEMTVPESVRASHILVKFADGDDDTAKAAKKTEAEAIRKSLLAGADFAETARAESDCPSGSSGGDLGEFGRGQMVVPFETAAFAQPVGEVGELVETQFGYHIIKVTGKTEGHERSLDEVRDQIRNTLLNRRRGEAFQDYIQELRAAATITYPGDEAAPAPAAPATATPAAGG